MGSRVYTFDAQTQLSDEASAVTSSAAATVGGSAKIIDFGANTRVEGVAIIDISAMDKTTGDEGYCFMIQGSSSASFASDIANLAEITVGGASAAGMGGAAASPIGRYELPFVNEQADITYRYVRLYRLLSGTSPSVTSKAFASVLC